MKRFKFYAFLIATIAVIGASGALGGTARAKLNYGYYMPTWTTSCQLGYIDWEYDCDVHATGRVCTINEQPAYQEVFWCNLNMGSVYYMRKIDF